MPANAKLVESANPSWAYANNQTKSQRLAAVLLARVVRVVRAVRADRVVAARRVDALRGLPPSIPFRRDDCAFRLDRTEPRQAGQNETRSILWI